MQTADQKSLMTSAQKAFQQGQWLQFVRCAQALLMPDVVPSEDTPPTPLPMRLELDGETTQQLLEGLLAGLDKGDFQTRWEIAKLLPVFGEGAIGPLLARLQEEDEDPEAQWFAVRILSQWPQPEVLQALLHCLQTTPHPEVQAMVVKVFGGLGSSAIVLIQPLLQQPSSRSQAVQILAQIRSRDTVPILLELSADQEASIRALAIEALASFHDNAITDRLLAALADPSATVRRSATAGLAFCHFDNPQQAIAQLQPLLWDPDLLVCCQAASSLGRIGGSAAVEALGAALQSSVLPELLGLELVRSLSWMETPESLQMLYQTIDADRLSPTVLPEALRLLGQIEEPTLKPRVAAWLLKRLESDAWRAHQPEAYRNLVVALGQLAVDRAIDPLIQHLAQVEPSLRWHVIAALKHFPIAHHRLQTMAQHVPADSPLGQGIAIALQDWQPSDSVAATDAATSPSPDRSPDDAAEEEG